MKTAEFVVRVANPFLITTFDTLGNPPDELLKTAIKFAVKNKVFPLFYDGCIKLGIRLPKEADVLINDYERRRRAHLGAVSLLLDFHERHGIEFMFFKTFRPFNYVADDIDILLRHKNELNRLISLLKGEGYRLLKIGIPEVTVRKIEDGTFVDVDVHTAIAAGHLVLFKAEKLWRNSSYKLVGGMYRIPTLSERYEVVRESAYSLLKDFTVSIPGLYLAINAFMKGDLSAIRRIAEEENLLLPLDFFMYVSHFLTYALSSSKAMLQLQYETKNASTIGLKLIRADLCRRLRIPYPYPIIVIALAYLTKVWLEIHGDRNLKALAQLIKQPSSKGTSILLNYIEERFVK